jgi:hypothetical protein
MIIGRSSFWQTLPGVILCEKNLPLQITELNIIPVDYANKTHTGPAKIISGHRSERTDTDYSHPGSEKHSLPLVANATKNYLP